jgi:hypothetical protein
MHKYLQAYYVSVRGVVGAVLRIPECVLNRSSWPRFEAWRKRSKDLGGWCRVGLSYSILIFGVIYMYMHYLTRLKMRGTHRGEEGSI